MTFPDDQIYCVLDYETFSEAPLKEVGSFEYSVHPSTEILCVAWAVGTKHTIRGAPINFWSDVWHDSSLNDLAGLILNPSVIKVAHNALFEQVISTNVLSKETRKNIPFKPNQWVCTAALAATLALPRSLENAAKVLGLKYQKDMEGARLIQKWCKPRRPTKKRPHTRHVDPFELERIVEYCKSDIKAEIELFLTLPPLTPTERAVWVLDQVINLRGFKVDRELTLVIEKMVALEQIELARECEEITRGVVRSATSVSALINWLGANGVYLENLQKKTVEDALMSNLVEGDARRLLEIRQSIGKTSTAKYTAFNRRSFYDSRIRDNLMYHGASTGRWSGAGVQAQNLPRPKHQQKDIDLVVGILKE